MEAGWTSSCADTKYYSLYFTAWIQCTELLYGSRGTNFDDWAARQQVTSYDYAAAIGEDGVVNERYRRFQGLSTFIDEHGTRIARADLVSLDYITTDTLVKLALRCAKNGDRYYFVRTEERSRQHFGTIRTDDLELDFALEPFGSMVYYLPAGATQGEWFPKLPDPQIRPATKVAKIELKKQVNGLINCQQNGHA